MKIHIPYFVEEVLKRLIDNGHEAYLVGGSIRDILMGKSPKDWDITTSALPDEVTAVFCDKKVVTIGEKYGTVTVVSPEGTIEVTTFRSESAYSDGRHPDWVHFEKNIEEDLSRRDFTINSIAYNNIRGLIDPFEGAADIKKGLIRAVGNPEERFVEDGLRIIRAVRFAANLNFSIDDATFAAAQKLSEMIKLVSIERIRDEFFKILTGANPSYGMDMLLDTNLIHFILPEILPAIGFMKNSHYHDKDVYRHTLCILRQTPNILYIRLAALFHGIGKPCFFTSGDESMEHFYGHNSQGADISIKVLRRLRCPNKVIKKVALLVDYHMGFYSKNQEIEIKKLIGEIGKENIFDVLSLQKADAMCKNNKRLIVNTSEMETAIKAILNRKEPITIEDLAINGEDLKQLGFEPSIKIGKILDQLLNVVIEKPELNRKEVLIQMVQNKWIE